MTLVALSEFGRRVAQNANYGLDHGYGNVMLAGRGGVKGGRYYGTLPRLTGDIDSDVPVTTDYRSVLRRGGHHPVRRLERHGLPAASSPSRSAS